MHLVSPTLFSRIMNSQRRIETDANVGKVLINQLNHVQNEDGAKVFISQRPSTSFDNAQSVVNDVGKVTKESGTNPPSNESLEPTRPSNQSASRTELSSRMDDDDNNEPRFQLGNRRSDNQFDIEASVASRDFDEARRSDLGNNSRVAEASQAQLGVDEPSGINMSPNLSNEQIEPPSNQQTIGNLSSFNDEEMLPNPLAVNNNSMFEPQSASTPVEPGSPPVFLLNSSRAPARDMPDLDIDIALAPPNENNNSNLSNVSNYPSYRSRSVLSHNRSEALPDENINPSFILNASRASQLSNRSGNSRGRSVVSRNRSVVSSDDNLDSISNASRASNRSGNNRDMSVANRSRSVASRNMTGELNASRNLSKSSDRDDEVGWRPTKNVPAKVDEVVGKIKRATKELKEKIKKSEAKKNSSSKRIEDTKNKPRKFKTDKIVFEVNKRPTFISPPTYTPHASHSAGNSHHYLSEEQPENDALPLSDGDEVLDEEVQVPVKAPERVARTTLRKNDKPKATRVRKNLKPNVLRVKVQNDLSESDMIRDIPKAAKKRNVKAAKLSTGMHLEEKQIKFMRGEKRSAEQAKLREPRPLKTIRGAGADYITF